ncbi:MAG: hypothetical protein C0418_04025 [Coriobacteriaceae bacterium]|nr:hypothetical protein [Coriobacteriaceae bacterium]
MPLVTAAGRPAGCCDVLAILPQQAPVTRPAVCSNSANSPAVRSSMPRTQDTPADADTLIEAARAMAGSLAGDADHERTVARLAVALFDATRELHCLDEEHRRLLEAGALLHDTGWELGGKGHHRSSERLVLDSDLPFADDRERAFAAAVARYHRKALPDPSHDAFSRLEAEDRDALRWCAALVRIADGLDRGHDAVVRELSAETDHARLTITARCSGDPELALWGAERKTDLLEAVSGLAVHILAEKIAP